MPLSFDGKFDCQLNLIEDGPDTQDDSNTETMVEHFVHHKTCVYVTKNDKLVPEIVEGGLHSSISDNSPVHTHMVFCSVAAQQNKRFSLVLTSHNEDNPRMGVLFYIDDCEQNRVGLTAKQSFVVNSQPISKTEARVFRFKDAGERCIIRVELWRSVVLEQHQGMVTYIPHQTNPSAIVCLENSEIDKNEKKTVSRVSYLDKHPWFVFVFEVMSEDEIAEKKRLFAKIEEKEPLEAENFARNHCSVVYTPSKSNHEVLVTRNLASALPGAMQAASLQNSLERAGWQPSW